MVSTQVMSTSGLIVPYNFARLHNGSGCRYRNIILNPSRFLVVPKQNMNVSCRNMVVYSGVNPIPPLPSDPSPASWKFWLLGVLITVISPFLRNNLGPMLTLRNKFETVVEQVEHITDIVEEVADKVEKVAEEFADHLPEGGKLKSAVSFIENVAKETAKDAHLADEFIDKVEVVEKKVESFIKPVVTDQANK